MYLFFQLPYHQAVFLFPWLKLWHLQLKLFRETVFCQCLVLGCVKIKIYHLLVIQKLLYDKYVFEQCPCMKMYFFFFNNIFLGKFLHCICGLLSNVHLLLPITFLSIYFLQHFACFIVKIQSAGIVISDFFRNKINILYSS